jgi:hypothetical protein
MLDARMMAWLLEQVPGVGFEALGGRLMVFEPRLRSSVDDLARALRRYEEFLEHVPGVVGATSPTAIPATHVPRPDR